MKYKLVAVALNEDGTCEQLCLCKNANEEEIIRFKKQVEENRQIALKEKEELKNELLKLKGEINKLRYEVNILKGEN